MGDILHLKEKASVDINEVTLLGGIDYSSGYTDKEVWSYLPGTKDEVEAINALLLEKRKKVNYKTAKEGTETYFKSVAEKSDIIHIATHGFFFPDPVKVRSMMAKQAINENTSEELAFRGNNQAIGLNSFTQNKDPLMRSGLVFASVHDLLSTERIVKEDDGILTAMEVSQMDLNKTELAVLSACETGLGEIKGNEGVYGLKRTFKIAGVKHLIISLWQVPDKETKEFMMLFYTKLFSENEITITEAFEYAQRSMRSKYDPYFWAAFVLIR